MEVRKYRFLYEDEDGRRVTDCELIASTTPETLPTNGVGIKGFRSTIDFEKLRFAGGSILYVVDNGDIYMANEDGEFILQE